MRYAYYPGCSLHSTAKEYDLSFRNVCKNLGLELREVPKWACCGSTPAHSTSYMLALALPAYTISQTEEAGFDKLLVPCASCFQRLKTAQYELKHQNGVRKALEEALERRVENKVDIAHPLEIFSGTAHKAIKEGKKKSLAGFKIACYYGCLLTRPPKVMQFDECEYPMSMDKTLRALGAETVDWNSKTYCCGASLALSKTECVLKLANDILGDAKAAGSNAIAVACPLCHANLDTRQGEVERAYGKQYGLPVFYFTQLIGLAFDIPVAGLGLGNHIVSPLPLLKELGFS
ncbi:MAG: CoB--CoM heterodisulfide reductase iron-sulfur subunit B family protein [Myxococcota bacterium]